LFLIILLYCFAAIAWRMKIFKRPAMLAHIRDQSSWVRFISATLKH